MVMMVVIVVDVGVVRILCSVKMRVLSVMIEERMLSMF